MHSPPVNFGILEITSGVFSLFLLCFQPQTKSKICVEGGGYSIRFVGDEEYVGELVRTVEPCLSEPQLSGCSDYLALPYIN